MLKTANSRLSKIINSNIKITEHPDLEVYAMNWYLDNKANFVLFEYI